MLKIKIANTFVEVIDTYTGHVVCSNYDCKDSKNVADNYIKLIIHLVNDFIDYEILDCRNND
jgi:ribonuclease HIII